MDNSFFLHYLRKMKLKKISTSWYVVTFLVVVIAETFLLSSYFMGANSSEVRAYAVPRETKLQEHSLGSINLVNRILNIGAEVCWIAEPISVMTVNGSMYSLNEGSFIIPTYQNIVKYGFQSSISHYVEKLSFELNLTSLKMSYVPRVTAYTLTSPRVAIYYGGGVTGGALWQIHPLETAGFNLGIITEVNIERGDLADYDVLVFPGGGAYLNYLSSTEIEEIKRFVEDGGGFLGTCGGLAFGVQIGLLNAQLAYSMQAPPDKHVNLRGPVILESTSPMHPVAFGMKKYFEYEYVLGPFINRVEDDVTVVAKYHASTPDLRLYCPEFFKAYNYTFETDLSYLDRFWGTPAVIAGEYGNGGVVLFASHPECLCESLQALINSVYFLSMEKRVSFRSIPDEEAAVGQRETCYASVKDLMRQMVESSSNARDALDGIDKRKNEDIIGFSAEFLELFMSDVHSRGVQLYSALPKLEDAYGKLKELEKSRLEYPNIYEKALPQMEHLRSRISSIFQSMYRLEELVHLMDVANEDLLRIADALDYILVTTLSEGERYQEIIDLHVMESLTLSRLKDRIDVHLLRWTFEIEVTLANVDFILSL